MGLGGFWFSGVAIVRLLKGLVARLVCVFWIVMVARGCVFDVRFGGGVWLFAVTLGFGMDFVGASMM